VTGAGRRDAGITYGAGVESFPRRIPGSAE
jgi:hypothetical protein